MDEKLKQLLDEIKAAFKGEDGQVINLADLLRQNGELKAKYEDVLKRLEVMEQAATGRRWASVPGMELEKDKFSLVRAIRAITTRDWSKAAFEKEVFDNTRAMSHGDDSAGGYLVPVQAIPDMIEMLRAEAVCFRLGATSLDGLVGAPVMVPKQTGGATVYWVAENTDITPSDLGVGQLTMTPKKAAALVKISNRLIRMSNPAVEGIVRRDVAIGLALAIDLAALRGSGSENQPLGIRFTPDIELKNASDASPNFDLFYDIEYQLAVQNALRGRLGFAFHPAVRRAICKLRIPQFSGDTAGEYVVPVLTDSQIRAYLGYPFLQTTQIPITLATDETEIFFANWIELIIAQWAGMEIVASQEAGDAFAKDQTWIRIITELDVGLRHEKSFGVIHNVKNA